MVCLFGAVQGLIDTLMSDTDEARRLRELFVFKIVPMLNPDGVFLGNYRLVEVVQCFVALRAA